MNPEGLGEHRYERRNESVSNELLAPYPGRAVVLVGGEGDFPASLHFAKELDRDHRNPLALRPVGFERRCVEGRPYPDRQPGLFSDFSQEGAVQCLPFLDRAAR